MGVRPVERIMHAAYLASALEAIPELLRLRAHLQALEELGDARVRSSAVYQELAQLLQQLQAGDLIDIVLSLVAAGPPRREPSHPSRA